MTPKQKCLLECHFGVPPLQEIIIPILVVILLKTKSLAWVGLWLHIFVWEDGILFQIQIKISSLFKGSTPASAAFSWELLLWHLYSGSITSCMIKRIATSQGWPSCIQQPLGHPWFVGGIFHWSVLRIPANSRRHFRWNFPNRGWFVFLASTAHRHTFELWIRIRQPVAFVVTIRLFRPGHPVWNLLTWKG